MEKNQDILIIEDSQATANLISDYLQKPFSFENLKEVMNTFEKEQVIFTQK